MAATGVKRVVLVTLGWEDLPKRWSVHGAPPEERLVEPVPGVLIEVDGGWLLLDTGFNPSLIRDLALRRRFHGAEAGIVPSLPPGDGDPLLDALDAVGIGLEEYPSGWCQPPSQRPCRRPAPLCGQGPGPPPALGARLPHDSSGGGRTQRHLSDRFRRPDHRLAPSGRRRRDSTRGHSRPDRWPYARPSEFRCALRQVGAARRVRVRFRCRRPAGEHRPRTAHRRGGRLRPGRDCRTDSAD